MIQGMINSILSQGAMLKKMGDIADEKAQKAQERAVKRANAEIKKKYYQREQFNQLRDKLKAPNASDELLKIVQDATKHDPAVKERMKGVGKTPDVRLGKDKIDISKFSPEAQKILRGEK